MRLTVVAMGKPRNADLAAAIRDYETRAARYWPLAVIELRDETARGRSPGEIRSREGERVRDALPAGCRYWLCDERGTTRTSREFATWLQSLREAAHDVAFVVGGAFGHSDALRASAAGRIAFGTLTLPHELARLVLAEQLYRAGTIVRGEPYHK